MRTQVTFDAANPHAQAAFWAAVLGLQVEDHSDFVDQLVADGRMPAEDRVTIGDRSAFRDVAACRDPDDIEPRLSSWCPRARRPRTVSIWTFTSSPSASRPRSIG
jgi:hypothetical protein